jgi:hypothetical protein
MLLPHEVDMKHCLKARLIQLLREEEGKWYQRSKSDNLLMGDSNTKYFQLVAHAKRRKTCIFQLEEVSQIIKGEDALKFCITDYDKGLFGPSNCDQLSLVENRINDTPQTSAEDNEKLTACFKEKRDKRGNF